ncbi:Hypothetical predicted protein [Pelobates cultripes]|uniref:L1 transposable element RRM domain-containing protein n=1 Tax=Pelobates cultripes TaxID=61616 RepID=A0AAD1VMI0_PELCU|nr:Hypothetical predicted protein [Pelobates cultripes]
MGGGRKIKQGAAEVAPIFRSRKDGGATREEEDGREYDSDSSDRSRTMAATPLTKEDLRQLLSDIKANMATEFDRHLTPIREGLIDLTHRTSTIEEQLDLTVTRTTATENAITALQEQLRQLEEAQEDLNNRSCRNNVRIRGIPETVTIEALGPTLRELFCGLLPEATPAELLLDRVHRALRAPMPNATQPRDVIIRVHYFHIKEALMQAARNTPLQIEGHQISFYQDLAPSTLRKRRELRPLTQELTRQHIRYSWGHPFKLQVRKNNRTYTLYNTAEMADFAESLGLDPTNLATDPNPRRHDRGPPPRNAPPTAPARQMPNSPRIRADN